MDGIFRRTSGVYFARISVPKRLRERLGRSELIASLNVRELQLAQIVGAPVIAGWRRVLRELEGRFPVDLLQVSVGSPLLASNALMPLHVAVTASGLDRDELLSLAAAGELAIYVVPGHRPGFLVPLSALDRDRETGGYDVPPPKLMPAAAQVTQSPGALLVRRGDYQNVVHALRNGQECPLVLFDVVGRPGIAFAPDEALDVAREEIHFIPRELEVHRKFVASTITAAQLEAARAGRTSTAKPGRKRRKASDVIADFMAERARACSPDQARRVQAACELFVELTGDPWLDTVDREFLRNYRDKLLPQVPANENKVRLQHHTSTVSESISVVAGTKWPRISEAECAKRMQWLCGMFEWLAQEKWLTEDPAEGLANTARSKTAARHSRRDLFEEDELRQIFSASWFRTGRGELTRRGTYREFLPYYYWLPLIGLYTGARINELCQLSLGDIRKSAAGTWYIDINEEDETGEKRIKNAQSRRQIPLHEQLLDSGLIEWRDALIAEGHTRLFPELSYDHTRGYSKAAVKWFSSYLRRLGWPRNGRLVFHSFRHTLASHCLNTLGITEMLTAQISGHQRSKSVLGSTYRKEVVPDELRAIVNRLKFNLPLIAQFDIEAGLASLADGLRRKRNRQERTAAAPI